MRNREGRGGSARTTRVASACPAVVSLAACLGGFACPSVAIADDGATGASAWLLLSVAADTDCAVVDDGVQPRMHCVGDRIEVRGPRLVRIEGQVAVFAVDGGPASTLHVRVAVGASFDAAAVRDRWLEATGPRPGWIEEVSIAEPESRR